VSAAADVIVDADGSVADVVDRCLGSIARFRGAP
jgi:hypothetical protein